MVSAIFWNFHPLKIGGKIFTHFWLFIFFNWVGWLFQPPPVSPKPPIFHSDLHQPFFVRRPRADEELEPEKVDLASLPVELLEEAKIPMGSFNDVAKAGPPAFSGDVFFFGEQKMVGFWMGGGLGWGVWASCFLCKKQLVVVVALNGDLKMNVFFGWGSRT